MAMPVRCADHRDIVMHAECWQARAALRGWACRRCHEEEGQGDADM
jgi:hypothetical protein